MQHHQFHGLLSSGCQLFHQGGRLLAAGTKASRRQFFGHKQGFAASQGLYRHPLAQHALLQQPAERISMVAMQQHHQPLQREEAPQLKPLRQGEWLRHTGAQAAAAPEPAQPLQLLPGQWIGGQGVGFGNQAVVAVPAPPCQEDAGSQIASPVAS